MATFSKDSEAKLLTVCPQLQKILYAAIFIMDFTVLEGLRNAEDQNKAVETGNSKVHWPNSKHNRLKLPDGTFDYEKSAAVDLVPYPVQWPNLQTQTTKEYARRLGAFYRLAGIIETIAKIQGVRIRWGGDFKSFFDGPHFEIVED